uniref:Orange domain-containing protein n=1 Tax=Xiphophorus couchianus TaxID=32473 RepID=A0A3B5LSW5_9TELE
GLTRHGEHPRAGPHTRAPRGSAQTARATSFGTRKGQQTHPPASFASLLQPTVKRGRCGNHPPPCIGALSLSLPFGERSAQDALRHPSTALNTDPSILGKYRAGFSECMNEVTRFLSTCEGVNTEVRTRLLGHLASCMTQINAMNYPSQHQHQHQLPPAVLPMNPASCKGGSPPASLPSDATKVYGGFQIVPATDGQFAFLIPNAAFAPNGPVIPVYANNMSTSVPVPAAVSPGAPSANTDSVWRPW